MKDALTKQWLQAIAYDDFHEDRFGMPDEKNKQNIKKNKGGINKMTLLEEYIKIQQQIKHVEEVQKIYADPNRNDERGYYAMEELKHELLEELKETEEEAGT